MLQFNSPCNRVGFLTLALYKLGSPLWLPAVGLIPFMFLVAFVDLARRYNPELGKVLMRPVPAGFLRPYEERGMSGTFWYIVGVLTVLAMGTFMATGEGRGRDLACLSILYLAWVDPTAAFVGRRWGRHRPGFMSGKSIEGSMAALIMGMLITRFFLGTRDLFQCLQGGLIAAFSEACTLSTVDDNLIIPILSFTLVSFLM